MDRFRRTLAAEPGLERRPGYPADHRCGEFVSGFDLAIQIAWSYSTMKIATLSIHTMRTRWSCLRDWLLKQRPDIAALQKIGAAKDFPTDALRGIGYESAFLGRASASDLGVAILSRCHLPRPELFADRLPGCQAEEARFLAVDIGRFRIASVYAPYGSGQKPDEAIAQRVAWLNRLRDHVGSADYASRDCLLCGDFNVIVRADGPPRQPWYSVREQNTLERLLDQGFIDLYREAHPDPKQARGFTFGFQWSSEGTSRLHLALASESLARRLSKAWVDTGARPRKESAPLMVEFKGMTMGEVTSRTES
ncbi:MAG: endonuclease/exonuclease/phosphatase family protein [bacterium]|nr:endonuclease/exonuclease/phosphatase family protein [bacterium]